MAFLKQIKNKETGEKSSGSKNDINSSGLLIDKVLVDAEIGLNSQRSSLRAIKMALAKKSEENSADKIYI